MQDLTNEHTLAGFQLYVTLHIMLYIFRQVWIREYLDLGKLHKKMSENNLWFADKILSMNL